MHRNSADFCAIPTVGTTLALGMVTVWSLSKSKIYRLLIKAPKSIRQSHLPYEIVEMILAYLAYDLYTLKECSLTCRSWHTIAAPLLHHIRTLARSKFRNKFIQSELLSGLHKPEQAHLVKKLRIKGGLFKSWFASDAFGHLDLDYFDTFANVHTLKLEYMDISSFIPGVKRYFIHFSPTLRSIVLHNPRCTPRQLSYFLSLFTNLDDIEIQRVRACTPEIIIPDRRLAPFSAPKLRGRLILCDFSWVETWTHLIILCGGLRFHYIRLPWNETYTPILLDECAKTLVTVRFDTSDGEFCRGLSTVLS